MQQPAIIIKLTEWNQNKAIQTGLINYELSFRATLVLVSGIKLQQSENWISVNQIYNQQQIK